MSGSAPDVEMRDAQCGAMTVENTGKTAGHVK